MMHHKKAIYVFVQKNKIAYTEINLARETMENEFLKNYNFKWYGKF